MTAVLNEVMTDGYLKNYVGYHAYKVARRFPNSMDREDAEQEIWEAIIKAMNKYDGRKTPVETARSAAFSKYGHMIDGRLRKLPFNEKMAHYDQYAHPQEFADHDPCYELVEANITLDRIEEILSTEANRPRQYRTALKKANSPKLYRTALDWFRLMRKGYSAQESADELSIPVDYLYVIHRRVFKSVVRNLPLV